MDISRIVNMRHLNAVTTNTTVVVEQEAARTDESQDVYRTALLEAASKYNADKYLCLNFR